MKRLNIILLLTVWYASVAGGCFLWFGKAYADSSPDITLAAVKGVSTTDLTTASTTVNLAPYPTIDESKMPQILSQEYALYNPKSGKVIVQSKDQRPVSIASTTKIMTAYLTMKYGKLDDVITVSKEVVSQPDESSLMGLHLGEKTSVKNLLYGAMLVSGNDAAYALGQYIGGKLLNDEQATSDAKIARFVTEMNATAATLGMQHTKYQDPVGINDAGHSTAVDLAKLMGVAEQNATLATITSTPTITIYDQSGYYRYDLRNSNRLVTDYQYLGAGGGKTGFTDAAGHCLIATATRNGVTLVAAILHTTNETNEASAIEARKLLDAGFSLIQWN